MIHADDKRLKRFIEKLQEEGSAGFTAAPPPTEGSAGFTVKPPPPQPPGLGRYTLPPKSPGIDRHARPKAASQPGLRWFSLIRPLMMIIFVLLLAAVVVFYLTRQAELDAITAQLDYINSAPVRDRLEQRLAFLESRLAERNDPYGQRMQEIEQRLTDNRRIYEQGLKDVELQLVQSREPYEARLQDIEQRLVQLRTTDDNRLQDVEQKLLYMTARFDEWTANMAQLAGNEKAVVAVNMAMTAEPPSALLLEPIAVGRNKKVPSKAKTRDTAASSPSRQGDWVINIASYAGAKTAARKLAYFQEQGVAAEQVEATVSGKTIYRVQVAGFDSLAAARGNARVIGEQLGIEDLWVKRR